MESIAIAPSECYQNGRLGHPFRKTGVQPKTRKAKIRHTDRQERCFKKEPSKNPKQTVQCQENLSKPTVFARSQAPWAHLGCIGKRPRQPKIGCLTCFGKPAQKPVHGLQGSGSKGNLIHRFFLQIASVFANPKPHGTSLGRGCGEKKNFLPASPDLV